MQQKKRFNIVRNEGWRKLSGELPVKMTNDYLFRALLQTDNETLQALIASVLGLKRDEISNATIENPIVLGEAIDDKEFILDAKVLLNGENNLDIEMQVVNLKDWPERSVSYLSRIYDQLNHGQKYIEAKTAIHIGFLNFTPNEDNPVFYSVNMLADLKTHEVYTDTYQLRYVDLTKINVATEEDKARGLVDWARMFRSKTWEELQMLAKKNKDIENAVSYVYPLTQEDELREQMRRREDFLASFEYTIRTYQEENQRYHEQHQKDIEQIQKRDEQHQKDVEQIQEKDKQLQKKDEEIRKKDELIARLMAQQDAE